MNSVLIIQFCFMNFLMLLLYASQAKMCQLCTFCTNSSPHDLYQITLVPNVQVKSWILVTFFCLNLPFSIQFYIKSRSSKNPGLNKSNLPQNSNFGREFVQKSGVQIPAPEGQIFLSFFLFIFKFSTKNCISLFLTIFEYLVLQIRYQ